MSSKYLSVLFLSVFFFALTYASASTKFLPIDLVVIACLLAVVFGVEYLIARLFARHPIVQNLVLAGLATINILLLNLILNEVFTDLPTYGQALALLLSLFIVFTFMNMLDENARIGRVLPAIFALATAGVLVQTWLSYPTVPEVSIEAGKTSAKNIQFVDFKMKPNVYFIGFDSLIPRVILQNHLGLEVTPYHEVLDTHFRRFRNFFADRVWTSHSLNSLLALDLGHFEEANQNETRRFFFSGLIPSPLFEVFKHNGYETTTYYRSTFFGQKKGPHVDNYRMAGLSMRWGVCEFVKTWGFRTLTFMGYCPLVKSKMFESVLRGIGIVVADQINQIEPLVESMRAGLQKGAPQIVVAYIFSPGHTDAPFDKNDTEDLDDYRQAYLKASKETAMYLNELVTFIANEDPEAIVYVFGDHGPELSAKGSFEEDDVFFVQDNFGVYGGIHPPNRCAEFFDQPYNKGFMTVLQGVHTIIRCLSDGKDAFLTLEDYHLPELETNIQHRYEDYVYE